MSSVLTRCGDSEIGLSENEPYLQLRMVWPEHLLNVPPEVRLPGGYALSMHRQGDESRFYEIMERAGWPGWDDEKLRPWLSRILPDGWFAVVHAETAKIVATAMALQDRSEFGRSGGELGWLACDPAHRGKGLGLGLSAAVTARLIREGYRHIHLYTEHWRLAAIKGYLRLGYVPFLYLPEMRERWQSICAHLQWPFTPERWKS